MPPTTRKKSSAVSAAEKKRRDRQKAAQAPAEPKKKLGRGGGWLKGSDLEPIELDLPSGATCLVGFPTPEELVEAGVDTKMDVLTSQVSSDLIEPMKGPRGQKRAVLGTELTGQQLIDVLELADRVTAAVVISPVVSLAPTPTCSVCGYEGRARNHPIGDHDFAPVPRNPDVIYTDGIDSSDKLFILDWALRGPKMLGADFPEQAESGVASVPAVEDVSLPAE